MIPKWAVLTSGRTNGRAAISDKRGRTKRWTDVAGRPFFVGDFTCRDIGHRRRYPTDMNRLLAIIVLSLTLGCTEPNQMPKNQSPTDASVQLFNEAVLGSSPTDAIPMLLTTANANWSPKQVVLDYKDGACYGAMVHYERSHSFEVLRSAVNSRFAKHEQPTFADDPTMGIWRMEDLGFTIQLSDDEDEDSFMAIYILFVDPETMATKLEELSETEPALFDDFPLEEFTDGLRNVDTLDSETPNGG